MQYILSLGYPKKEHLNMDEWGKYKAGALQIIDWETGQLIKGITYVSPPGMIARDGSIQFKAGTLYNEAFFVPTNTEILVYDLPDLKLKKKYSHQSFNDVHHVTVINDLIYICNTGLEIIQVMNFNGDIIEEHNAAVSDTWKRFNRETDYRMVPTTKPREAHANFIFSLGDELWCTRFLQKDAICIGDNSKKIALNVSHGSPHDGLVSGDFIYFTLTDGYVVIINKNNLKREAVIDLNKIYNNKGLLGWCRGIEVVGQKCYVGFTALRTSKYREYGLWIKHGRKPLGSRIAEFDLSTRTLAKELPVAQETGAAIFTIKRLS